MASSSQAFAAFKKIPIRNTLLSITALTWADMQVSRWQAKQSNVDGRTHLTRMHETPRKDWIAKTKTSGLTYATLPGVRWGYASSIVCSVLPRPLLRWLGFEDPYWNERASYRVSEEGMWRIEKASFELHSLILEAVEEVIQSDYLLQSFGIPTELWPAMRKSWENRESDLLGRFDFLWDGEGEPMLAEYNADTPTVLIESAAAQRDWLKEKRPDYGQFNVLDEAIQDGWRKIAEEQFPCRALAPAITVATQGASFWNDPVSLGAANGGWFASVVDSIGSNDSFQEEAMTGKYLHKLAVTATSDLSSECQPKHVDFDTLQPEDFETPEKGALWKLYPWEWLVYENVGEHIRSYAVIGDSCLRRRILEPPWKLVASSKAMLAYLYRKHPRHPNLLPAALADELVAVDPTHKRMAKDWVAKPVLGREGTGLSYGEDSGAKTFREFADLAKKSGQVLVIPNASPPPGNDAANLRDTILHGVKEAPVVRRFLHGPIDTKPEEHVQLHLGPPVVQQYYNVASMHGRYVVTSAWVVRGMPVAACFREDNEKTTNNNSCFVPHFVEPAEMAPMSSEFQGTCGCPPRPFHLTENQRRIRTDLYGEGTIHSARYRNVPRNSNEDNSEATMSRTANCYGARGYSGRGVSSTGGGSNYHGSSASSSTRRGIGRWFRTSGNKKSREEVLRQEKARKGAKQASSASKVSSRARCVVRTGGHGHATARSGSGYGG